MLLNTVFTFGALVVTIGIGSIVTYPDVPVWPIVAAGLAVAIFLPLVLYPMTFTLWFAVDVVTNSPEDDELADAGAALAAGAASPGEGDVMVEKSG